MTFSGTSIFSHYLTLPALHLLITLARFLLFLSSSIQPFFTVRSSTFLSYLILHFSLPSSISSTFLHSSPTTLSLSIYLTQLLYPHGVHNYGYNKKCGILKKKQNSNKHLHFQRNTNKLRKKKTLHVSCILYSVKKCMVTFKFNIKKKKTYIRGSRLLLLIF